MNAITLQRIVTVIFILASLRLVKLILKKERRKIYGGLLFFIFSGLTLFYIQHNETRNMSLAEIKELILPGEPPQYNYHIEERLEEGVQYTRYIFDDPKPKFSLAMDSKSGYFRISNISSINAAMEVLNLPKVSSTVPELASITGSSYDVGCYRWKDYQLGILLIKRGLCREVDKLSRYHCISSITIIER